RAARAQVVGARPAALERHERRHPRRVATREQLVLAAVEAGEVLERQVEPPPRSLLVDGAEDVGQREGGAPGLGVVEPPGGGGGGRGQKIAMQRSPTVDATR